MGIAIGQIGMSLSDFIKVTPEEFSSIHQNWLEKEENKHRTGWEQARMMALCILQPHSKSTLHPRDVMQFEWDRDTNIEIETPLSTHSDFEKLKERWG